MRLGILLCFVLLPCLAAAAPRRPRNVLIILADDMGWGDVSWADRPEIPTPNLEKLKNNGIELTRFYSQPKCTAARTALMAGRYAYHMGTQTNDVFSRWKNHTLDLNLKLMPQYMKDLGYHTHMVGKWHLGFCTEAATPTARGFDSFFGSWDNTKDHFHHGSKHGYDWQWYREGKKEPYLEGNGTYNTFLITDHTNKLLRDHFGNPQTAKEPIFIYTAYLAPHKPAMVPPEYEQDPLCQKFDAKDVRRTYCGMVKALDEGVGKIVATLKELNVLDDFFIVFTSDNGAANNVGASAWPLRGHKQTVYEGGTRVRTIMHSPKFFKKENRTYDGLVHITDLLPTLYVLGTGKIADLPAELDGRNVLWDIKNNRTNGRMWMVYNIDSHRELGAIRLKNATHNFKLVATGSDRYCPGWPRDPRPESERTDGKKKMFKCPPNGYRLFDLSTNPEELEPPHAPDAFTTNKRIFNLMKWKLGQFKKTEVPTPTYVKLDRNGPGRPWNNNGVFGVGDCDQNVQIAEDRKTAAAV